MLRCYRSLSLRSDTPYSRYPRVGSETEHMHPLSKKNAKLTFTSCAIKLRSHLIS